MAVVQNTLIGKTRGSVGNATFTTWKGLNVLKSKAVTVANPRSLGQVSQRAKLTLIVMVYREISSVIKRGFKSGAVNQSEYNAFTSQNIVSATSTDGEGRASLETENLLISKGSMGSTQIDSITAIDGSNTINVGWLSSPLPIGGAGTDSPLIAVYNETQNVWGAYNGNGTRTDEEAEFSMTENFESGDLVSVYLGFYSNIDGNASDSMYLSTVVV